MERLKSGGVTKRIVWWPHPERFYRSTTLVSDDLDLLARSRRNLTRSVPVRYCVFRGVNQRRLLLFTCPPPLTDGTVQVSNFASHGNSAFHFSKRFANINTCPTGKYLVWNFEKKFRSENRVFFIFLTKFTRKRLRHLLAMKCGNFNEMDG
jgi:hypothetical protein